LGRFLEWSGYLFKRIFFVTGALLGVIILTFFVTRKVGTPIYLMVGTEFDKEMIESVAHRIGTDQPVWTQFKNYLTSLLQGNLGYSRISYNMVRDDLVTRMPATVELALFSFALILLFALPAGIVAGMKRNSYFDRGVRLVTSLGVATPNFWLGLLLIYIFFYLLRWFPAPMGRISPLIQLPKHITGLYILDSILTLNGQALASSLHHILLPGFTTAFCISPHIVALARASTIYNVRSNYMQNAYSFGLKRPTIAKYLAKNIASPVMVILGLTLARMFGGIIMIEVVFSWPGIGLYAVNAMQQSDYDPVLGIVILSAIILSLMYFIVDIVSAFIDPRVRLIK